MKWLRTLVPIFALLFSATSSFAACEGTFNSADVCANSTASGAIAKRTPFSTLLSRYGVTGTGAVVLQNNPVLAGLGYWGVGNYVATNTTSGGGTDVTMSMNAKWLNLYNPNTDARRTYKPGTVTNILARIDTSGAGGRDTGAAFTYGTGGENLYLYYVAGTSGLSAVYSRTCPTCSNGTTTGPVLPAGYDTYVLAHPFVISEDDTLVHDNRRSDESTRCTLTGGISNGGGLAGTVFNVTAVAADCLVGGHAIAIGRTVRGTGVTPGTKITALGTGVGGVGTYTVNKSQLIAAGTPGMTTTTKGNASFIVLNNRAKYTSGLLVNLTGVVTFGSTFNWAYNIYLPANISYNFSLLFNFEISAAGPGGSTTSGLFTADQSLGAPCVGNQGYDIVHSTYAYGDVTTPFTYNPIIDVMIFPTSLGCVPVMPISPVSVGSPNSPPTAVLFVRYYDFNRE